jgi:DNA-binding MarR family transcriptional regulator
MKTIDGTLTDVEERAWAGFARAHFAIDRELDAMLHTTAGLSIGDFFVLHLLNGECDRQRRLTELAGETLFTLSGISRIINNLVDRGLVERERDPSDARANLVAITEAGTAQLEAIQPDIVALIRRRFLDHFSPDELATMAEFWSRINQ